MAGKADLAAALRRRRERRGLSMNALARLTGVSQGSISHTEDPDSSRAVGEAGITAIDTVLTDPRERGTLVALWAAMRSDRRATSVPVPRQIPPAPVLYGRQDVHDDLVEVATRRWPASTGTGVLIEVSGMAGVGKSALVSAVVAVLAAARPDAAVLAGDCGGWSHTGPATTMVLARWARDLGTTPRGDDRDAAVAAWRTAVAAVGRPVLAFADNLPVEDLPDVVITQPQVLVITTSRRRDLGRAHGLVPNKAVNLPPLTSAATQALLAHHAGRDDAPEIIEPLVEWCSGWPLAATIIGGFALRHVYTIADAHRTRADLALEPGDFMTSSLSFSYRDLSPDARLALRRSAISGLAPTLSHAQVLTGLSRSRTVRALGDLVEANMLAAEGHERYVMHDQVGSFATAAAALEDDGQDVLDAIGAGIDWHIRAILKANRVLGAGRDILPRYTLAPPRPDTPPLPTFQNYLEALEWSHAHWTDSTAALDLCVRHGWWTWAWMLVAAQMNFAFNEKLWESWANAAKDVLRALPADQVTGRAWMAHVLGTVRGEQALFGAAINYCRQAVELRRRIRDDTGEQVGLGWSALALGRFLVLAGDPDPDEVVALLDEAEAAHTAAGVANGIACAHGFRAQLALAGGDVAHARHHVDLGLHVAPGVQDPVLAAWLRGVAAETAVLDGDWSTAEDAAQTCLDLAESSSDEWNAIGALVVLGSVAAHHGHTTDARDHWTRALSYAELLDDPRTAEIRARLDDLPDPASP